MADDNMELDQLFASARRDRSVLPDDLVVRIQTDAEAVRLGRIRPARQRRWNRILNSIGGWQGMGGLVAASAAGIWIGFAAPGFLPDPAGLLTSQDTSYLVADLGFDTTFLESTE